MNRVVTAILTLLVLSAMVGLVGFGLGYVVAHEFERHSTGMMVGMVGGATVGSIWAATLLILGAIRDRRTNE